MPEGRTLIGPGFVMSACVPSLNLAAKLPCDLMPGFWNWQEIEMPDVDHLPWELEI